MRTQIRINNAVKLAEVVELAAKSLRGGYSALAPIVGVNRTTLYRWVSRKVARSISRKTLMAVCSVAGVKLRAVTGIGNTTSGMGASAVKRSHPAKVLSRNRKAFAAPDFDLQAMLIYWTLQRDGAVVSILLETLRDSRRCAITGCWPDAPDIIVVFECSIKKHASKSITSAITVSQDNHQPVTLARWECDKLNPVEISNALSPKRIKRHLSVASNIISTLRALTK